MEYRESLELPPWRTPNGYRLAVAVALLCVFAANGQAQRNLAYSTYLGGTGDDAGYAVAIDSSGNRYIAGYTTSLDVPGAGSVRPFGGGVYDAVVTKINSAGAIVYSTYLGGSGDDEAFGIAVDSSGNAYITGYTDSTDFPVTAGAYQGSSGGGRDAFVAKLSPTGTLVYATYLGGAGDDIGFGIALDGANNITVAGSTSSTNFPITTGAYQVHFGGGATDAFVAQWNPAGTVLAFSTFLGGGDEDAAYGVAVDSGNAYVTGYTRSSDFPTTASAFQASAKGGYDAFVTALNPSGKAAVYSTFLGGSGEDYGLGIAVLAGNAYITGYTASADFPTTDRKST